MALKKTKLIALRRAIPQALDRAAKETAQAALQIRNRLVPVDTGALLESGEIVAGPKLGHWVMREGAGLPDARAHYTEWGTDKAPAQPHMMPAAEQARTLLPANVKKHVKAVIK